MWIDSHCHLNFPDFSADLASVLQRARDAEVDTFLTICTRMDEIQAIYELSEAHDLLCSVGIHPEAASNELSEEELLTWLVHWAQQPRVVGIGETGLDATYDNGIDIQRIFLRAHLQAAHQQRQPLIIHSRGAEFELLQEFKAMNADLQGVIHCFTGSLDFAKEVLNLGFYISVSGIITFKNAQDLREILRYVPLDRLLIETDAPFLAPVPYRGKRNEPAFVVKTGEFVADLLEVPVIEFANLIQKNFHNLFMQHTRVKKN